MKYFDGKNKIVQTKKSNYKKGKRIFFFFFFLRQMKRKKNFDDIIDTGVILKWRTGCVGLVLV